MAMTREAKPPPVPAEAINAAALLLEAHDADRTALVCGELSLTRGELRDRVARCAALWRARGIGDGDRVAVMLIDGFDWVIAFLGTIWAGAVAVAVNPRLPAAEWGELLDEAGFSLILAASAENTPPRWRESVWPLADWRQALPGATPLQARPLPADAPALCCYSSGTSGKPKAVVHAQRFARHVDHVSRDGLGLRAGDRLYASSKLFFVYPQANSLFAGLKLGATVILDPAWPTAAGVAAGVAAMRPSVLFCVPSLYRDLLHEGLAGAIAASGVRLCVSAGEALPFSLRDTWREATGLRIVSGYGASETMVLVMLDTGDGRGLRPSPGTRVVPEQSADVGAPTRVLIRTPMRALGYVDRPQAQADAFRDEGEGEGAYCPADLFIANETGGWQFAGREDSLVKIGARWVDLSVVAECMSDHTEGVIEAAAVCLPDADGVEAVALFYVAADATAAAAALRDRAATLPKHQRPRWLQAVDALPRTATGKLMRRQLRTVQVPEEENR